MEMGMPSLPIAQLDAEGNASEILGLDRNPGCEPSIWNKDLRFCLAGSDIPVGTEHEATKIIPRKIPVDFG